MGPKRMLLAATAGTASAGAAFAMAATLGGLTTNQLGADTTVVSSCDEGGVTIDYTTEFDAGEGVYEVTAVVISDIDSSCDDHVIDVSMSNADGSQSASATQGTLDLDGNADSITLTVDDFDARWVDKVAVVIQGAAA